MNRVKVGGILLLLVYLVIMTMYSKPGDNIKVTLAQKENESIIPVNEVPVKNFELTVDTDLTVPSNVTIDDIDRMLSGTELEGMGSAFVRVEKELRNKCTIYDGLSLSREWIWY